MMVIARGMSRTCYTLLKCWLRYLFDPITMVAVVPTTTSLKSFEIALRETKIIDKTLDQCMPPSLALDIVDLRNSMKIIITNVKNS